MLHPVLNRPLSYPDYVLIALVLSIVLLALCGIILSYPRR
jgi:hypothetical protein